jgi:hypothetical protein
VETTCGVTVTRPSISEWRQREMEDTTHMLARPFEDTFHMEDY